MELRCVCWMLMNLLLLSACGAPDNKSETSSEATPEQVKEIQEEAAKVIDRQLANLQEKEAATFPCSLFPQEEIEGLAGNPLDKGSYMFNHVSEDGRNYRSESCDWSAKSGEGNEVSLWVSLPKHFDSGKVECSPGIANRKISGIGDQAWWDYQDYFGVGTLRVCSAKAMLEAKVTLTSKDEPAAKRLARTITEKILMSQ